MGLLGMSENRIHSAGTIIELHSGERVCHINTGMAENETNKAALSGREDVGKPDEMRI